MPTEPVAVKHRRQRPVAVAVVGCVALFAAVLLLTAIATREAAAQGLNPFGNSTGQPIDVTSDNGIEWQQDKQVYIARGNAVARRGASEIYADVLTAHYRPSKNKSAEGGNEVYRLDADGHVVMKGPNQTVFGDQAVWDVDQQIGIVTGNHLKLTTSTDTVTARDSLEWYDQQQVAVARGDAIAIRGDRRVRADVLTAHFVKQNGGAKPGATGAAAGKPATVKLAQNAAATGKTAAAAGKRSAGGAADPAAGNSKISRVDAQGHVVVVTTNDVGRGDYGVYNAETGIVTLLGNVSVSRGQDTVRGEYAVVDLNTNISRIMTVAARPGAAPPRVEGLFYRQDAAGAASGSAKSGGKPAVAGAPKS